MVADFLKNNPPHLNVDVVVDEKKGIDLRINGKLVYDFKAWDVAKKQVEEFLRTPRKILISKDFFWYKKKIHTNNKKS